MADRTAVLERKSRIASTRVVSMHVDFKDAAYGISYEVCTPQAPTGYKEVFRLTSPDGPTFSARWDQKEHEMYKEGALDIGMPEVPKEVEMAFKRGENGSAGHHTSRLGDNRYLVELVYEGRRILSGVVHVGVDYEGEVRCSMKLNVLWCSDNAH